MIPLEAPIIIAICLISSIFEGIRYRKYIKSTKKAHYKYIKRSIKL